MGDGVLMDISDRAGPRVISRVQDDEHFAFCFLHPLRSHGR